MRNTEKLTREDFEEMRKYARAEGQPEFVGTLRRRQLLDAMKPGDFVFLNVHPVSEPVVLVELSRVLESATVEKSDGTTATVFLSFVAPWPRFDLPANLTK